MAKSTLLNTSFLFAGQILPILIGLIAIPILTIELGMERYGILTLLWAVVGYFALFDMGISRALIQHLSALKNADDPLSEARVFAPSFVGVFLLSSFAAVVLYFISDYLGREVLEIPQALEDESVGMIQVLAIAVPFVTMSAILRGALEAERAFFSVGIVQALNGALLFLAPMLVAYFTIDLMIVAWGVGISRIAVFVMYGALVIHKFPHYVSFRTLSFSYLRPVLRLGGWMTLSNLVGPLLIYMDRFFIGTFVTASAIAFYTTPFEVVSRTLVLPTALFRVLFPSLSSAQSAPEGRAEVILRRGLSFLSLLLIFVLFPLLIFAKEGLYFWLGEEFATQSDMIAKVLILGVFFNAISGLLLTYAHSKGRPDVTAKIHIMQLLPYVGLLLLCVQYFGIIGAAIAWSIRSVADTLALTAWLCKIDVTTRNLLPSILKICGVFFLLLLPAFIFSSDLSNMGFWLTVKFLYYFSATGIFANYLLFFVMTQDDREYLGRSLRRLFRKQKGNRVLILSKYDRKGASSRLRTLQYIEALKSAGLEVDYQPLFSEAYLDRLYKTGKKPTFVAVKCYLRRIYCLRTVFSYDLIWIEKEIFPWLPSSFEGILNLIGVPYVVDYDDAIFHNYDLHRNALVRRLLGNKIPRVIKRSAGVMAGNEYLKNYAESHGAAHATWVPTVVDLERYRPIDSEPVDGPVTVGWVGSPSSFDYLLAMEELFQELESRCNVKFLFVGTGHRQLELKQAEHLPWTEEDEAELISRMDIGIMPISDSPWDLGKCGYKLIQYMAMKKPVVASNVGANKCIVEHGVNGFLVESREQWLTRLTELVNDASLRRSLGCAGRMTVEETYSLQVQSQVVVDVLERILHSEPLVQTKTSGELYARP